MKRNSCLFYKMAFSLMSMQHLRSVDATLPREYILWWVTIGKIEYICIQYTKYKYIIYIQYIYTVYIIQYYIIPSNLLSHLIVCSLLPPSLPKAQGTIVLPTLGWYRLVELGIFPSVLYKVPRCDRSSQKFCLNCLGEPKRCAYSFQTWFCVCAKLLSWFFLVQGSRCDNTTDLKSLKITVHVQCIV